MYHLKTLPTTKVLNTGSRLPLFALLEIQAPLYNYNVLVTLCYRRQECADWLTWGIAEATVLGRLKPAREPSLPGGRAARDP